MNRLWVRFALAIAGLLLFVAIVPALFNVAMNNGVLPRADSRFAEIWDALPPDARTEFVAAFHETVTQLLLRLILSAAAIGILAGVLLSRMLTAPLQALEAGAQAVARKELSHRVPEQGSDEIRAVAQAFNQMAAQLEHAEKARRSMLADVAHELRHPIHVIQGNLQAILDDVYPMSKEEIGRLVNQTRHLATLVNDLHELAQAEAHQLPLQKQPTDIATLIKETTALFKPVAGSRDVALHVELLGAMPTLEVDGRRLRQAFSNLLSNALQHTPPGGRVVVFVELVQEWLEIRVQDSGSGISAAQLAHIFDRFYRGDAARSRDRDGTGLGLAIARGVARAHGGDITLRSTPGQGAEFTLVVPLAAAPNGALENP